MKTRIRPKLLQRAFRRALFLGIPGGVLLALSWLFPLPLLLIAFGMMPYRRLSRLQSQPDQLVWHDGTLLYMRRGKVRRAIPRSSIQRFEYRERGHLYGIALHLDGDGELFLPYFESEPALEDVVHADEADEMV